MTMLTLWSLIKPKKKANKPADSNPRKAAPSNPDLHSDQVRRQRSSTKTATQPKSKKPTPNSTNESMRDKYARVTQESLETYGVRVCKWRTSMTGCAWEVYYHDGRTSRLIEAPCPKGPMSAAIFLHEIGHHAIGLGRYSPRCLEEYHAWMWSITEMQRQGLNVTEPVHRRMRESLEYALDKALRRGLKRIPLELETYLER
jgi:hypothetical protein